jgi:serine protease Do
MHRRRRRASAAGEHPFDRDTPAGAVARRRAARGVAWRRALGVACGVAALAALGASSPLDARALDARAPGARCPHQDEPGSTPEDAAAIAELRALEERVRRVAVAVRPAVVALVIVDGERSGAGSGVLISEDGWIATAAHVGFAPGRAVRVHLADGTELEGRTVGQVLDRDVDVGLVKAESAGRALPFAPLGSAAALKPGDPLVVFGHPLGPELTPWRPPPLRVGRVIDKRGAVIGMDAPVSPGDSGGPVLDLDGRVVGITSVATGRPDMNAAITVDTLVARMAALRAGAREGEGFETGWPPQVMVDLERAVSPVALRAQGTRRDALLGALTPLVQRAADSVVSVLVDARAAALGVLVDERGRILTKASEVGFGPRQIQVAMPDGLIMPARRVARDDALDLLLLEARPTGDAPIEWSEEEPALGAAILSVGPGIAPVAVGFRSLGGYDAGASDQASRSYIGVALAPGTEGARITAVMPGSGAAEADLRAGDVLLTVDGTPMVAPDSAGPVLRAHAPGDTIRMEILREGERRAVDVRLQRPFVETGPGNVGAALSRRATGFGPVIQHDGVVPAEAMGAPIVDSAGHVVGLNIARADRTKTYALPSAIVRPAVERLLAAAARGESAEPPDLRETLAPVEFGADGSAWLRPGAGMLFGPTLVLAGGSDGPRTLEGWASPEDVAAWAVRIPGEGRYEVHLDASLMDNGRRTMAGGKVDVLLNGDIFTATIGGRNWRAGDDGFQLLRVGETFVEEPGLLVLRVQPLDRPVGPIMRLRGVRVQRVETLRLMEQALPFLRYRDMERLAREKAREDARERARRANEFRPEQPQ